MSKKILFYATYPTQFNGYAKVANILSNFLADNDYEVYYFGISNFEGANVERYIDPRIKLIDVLKEEKAIGSSEIYGVDIIEKFLEEIKPDLFFIYNDLIVTNRLFLALNQYAPFLEKMFKTYVYIDLVYPFERLDFVEHMNRYSDKLFVFSELWKQNLISMDIPEEKIHILPHGFITHKFYKVNKETARKKLGLPEDGFLVLNTNRNSYRKALDITIASFLRFYKKVKNNTTEDDTLQTPKLIFNCQLKEVAGYDLLSVIKTECKILELDYNDIVFNTIFAYKNNLSDEQINYLYNASDVGMNTCIGEGFGLCSMEHAGLDVPQLASGVGGLRDIFGPIIKDLPILISPSSVSYVSNLQDEHGGYVMHCNADDFTGALEVIYKNKELAFIDGLRVGKYIREKYNWDRILEKFRKDLE